MHKVIGLCGAAGSGKSTAAQHLMRQGYVRTPFAAPLKNMIRALGFTEEHTDGALKDEPIPELGGRAPRYAMQTLGTEWGRQHMGNTFWVDMWKALKYDKKVADDLRFQEEVDAIHEAGGIVIRILRPQTIVIPGKKHASERDDLSVDFQVLNTGTVSELHRRIDRIISGEYTPQ